MIIAMRIKYVVFFSRETSALRLPLSGKVSSRHFLLRLSNRHLTAAYPSAHSGRPAAPCRVCFSEKKWRKCFEVKCELARGGPADPRDQAGATLVAGEEGLGLLREGRHLGRQLSR